MKSGARAWTQDVPLARSRTTGPIAISVTAGGKTSAWSQGEEIAIRAAQTGINRLTVKDAPVVFIGYGVKAPERNWDDFKGFGAEWTMLFDLGQKLANSRVWPEWKDGAEFKATRNATKAMRK